MIAVVFGIPDKSTHLWYHMFSPGDLENSYMTGFMVCFNYDKEHFAVISIPMWSRMKD